AAPPLEPPQANRPDYLARNPVRTPAQAEQQRPVAAPCSLPKQRLALLLVLFLALLRNPSVALLQRQTRALRPALPLAPGSDPDDLHPAVDPVADPVAGPVLDPALDLAVDPVLCPAPDQPMPPARLARTPAHPGNPEFQPKAIHPKNADPDRSETDGSFPAMPDVRAHHDSPVLQSSLDLPGCAQFESIR